MKVEFMLWVVGQRMAKFSQRAPIVGQILQIFPPFFIDLQSNALDMQRCLPKGPLGLRREPLQLMPHFRPGEVLVQPARRPVTDCQNPAQAGLYLTIWCIGMSD